MMRAMNKFLTDFSGNATSYGVAVQSAAYTKREVSKGQDHRSFQ